MPKTNLLLPDELATALDDLMPWAKHQRYIKRNHQRNDLIRYLLRESAARMREEMEAATKRKK